MFELVGEVHCTMLYSPEAGCVLDSGLNVDSFVPLTATNSKLAKFLSSGVHTKSMKVDAIK